MLMLPISVNAQQKNDSYDWTKVIDAIVKVESKAQEYFRLCLYW